MNKPVLLGLVASFAVGLAAMSLPAAAATSAAATSAAAATSTAMTTGPATSPFCNVSQSDIDDESVYITQKLVAKGYSVDSLQDSGGCLEASVHLDGVAHILRLDPIYLTPVGPQG